MLMQGLVVLTPPATSAPSAGCVSADCAGESSGDRRLKLEGVVGCMGAVITVSWLVLVSMALVEQAPPTFSETQQNVQICFYLLDCGIIHHTVTDPFCQPVTK